MARPPPKPGVDAPILAPASDVLLNQRLLKVIGFYPGTPNGLTDSAYFAAIDAFRRDQALGPGSTLDPRARSILQKWAESGVRPPTEPLPGADLPPAGGSPTQARSTASKLATLALLTAPAWATILYTRLRRR